MLSLAFRDERIVALALWVIAGLGKIVVGLVPENSNIDLHLLGAFNIPVGSAAILLLSLSILRRRRGLGAGGMERVADHPGSLWVLVIGVIALTLTGARHDKVSASPVS